MTSPADRYTAAFVLYRLGDELLAEVGGQLSYDERVAAERRAVAACCNFDGQRATELFSLLNDQLLRWFLRLEKIHRRTDGIKISEVRALLSERPDFRLLVAADDLDVSEESHWPLVSCCDGIYTFADEVNVSAPDKTEHMANVIDAMRRKRDPDGHLTVRPPVVMGLGPYINDSDTRFIYVRQRDQATGRWSQMASDSPFFRAWKEIFRESDARRTR